MAVKAHCIVRATRIKNTGLSCFCASMAEYKTNLASDAEIQSIFQCMDIGTVDLVLHIQLPRGRSDNTFATSERTKPKISQKVS